MNRDRIDGDSPVGIIRNRTFVLLVVCGIIAFVALGVRLYTLQVVRHSEFEARAMSQQTRETTVFATRGTIYDVNGKVLAANAAAETVYMDPYTLHEKNEDPVAIATQLELLLGVDRDDIIRKFANANSRGLPVKWKIEAEEAAPLRAYLTENKISSVYLENDSKRYYPLGTLASNVIGFVGTSNAGLMGLEARFNSYLTGTDGRIIRLKDVTGTEMLFSDYENYFEAQNGGDMTLTIDSTIQYYAEKNTEQAIGDNAIQKGAACIVMDPNTGELRALVSLGNYDLNAPFEVSEDILQLLADIENIEERSAMLADAQERQWRNKAVSDTYEPGSVFKIITLAIALEEGIIDEHSTFTCNGSMEVAGREEPLHCWNRNGHGTQTLSEAMQNSCNVALVSMGLQIGAEKYYEYIEAFGLRTRTGIDVPAEADSLWWPDDVFKDPYNKSQLGSAAFGQTFTITPIQMITAVSATVNGGTLYKPHIVKNITDAGGNIIQSYEPEAIRQVISADTSAIVRRILEDVVSSGTGVNASVKGYRIGGKTGTSEKTAENAAKRKLDPDAEKEYIVSFCGIAPMDDPQLVVLTLLDTPKEVPGNFISGGNMVAPVVGSIFSDVLPYLGIMPQYTEEELAELNVLVPKLGGVARDEAERQILASGINVRFVGEGDTVTAQLPSANAMVSPGTTVVVYLGGAEPDNEPVTVPSVKGKSYRDAKAALEAAGLFVRTVGVPISTAQTAVTIQSVEAGIEVARGSVVELVLIDKSIQGLY